MVRMYAGGTGNTNSISALYQGHVHATAAVPQINRLICAADSESTGQRAHGTGLWYKQGQVRHRRQGGQHAVITPPPNCKQCAAELTIPNQHTQVDSVAAVSMMRMQRYAAACMPCVHAPMTPRSLLQHQRPTRPAQGRFTRTRAHPAKAPPLPPSPLAPLCATHRANPPTHMALSTTPPRPPAAALVPIDMPSGPLP